MIYAPVIIPTLNRYEHLKNCLESLSKCSGAENTEVYIGLDYPSRSEHLSGYKKIRDYLDNCGDLGFKKLTVIKRERNYGLGANGNYASLKDMIQKEHDCYISTEDDNIFAPNFLEFMNLCLCRYKDDLTISSVCGYNPSNVYKNKYEVLLTPFVTAWCMGHWTLKEKDYSVKYMDVENVFKHITKRLKIWFVSPILYRMMCHMILHHKRFGDVCSSIYNIIHNQYQVRPSCNLVINNGFDGSGTNCEDTTTTNKINQTISQEKHYPSIETEKRMGWRIYFFYKLGFTIKAIYRSVKDLYYVVFPQKLINI